MQTRSDGERKQIDLRWEIQIFQRNCIRINIKYHTDHRRVNLVIPQFCDNTIVKFPLFLTACATQMQPLSLGACWQLGLEGLLQHPRQSP